MPQVIEINFCLLHAHFVTKYMLSIARTWSVIFCGGKHAGWPWEKASVFQNDVAF